ncbi:hypothetical protein MD484_g3278, partial [Candolleomyces efflorescens]
MAATTISGLPSSLAKLETLSHSAVLDALQKEFSPLIDSALVAAILGDIDFPTIGAPTASSPSPPPSGSTAHTATAPSNAVRLPPPSKSDHPSLAQPAKKNGNKGGKKKSKARAQSQTTAPGRQEGPFANAHTSPTTGASADPTALLRNALFELYETLKALAVQAEAEAGLGVGIDAQHEAEVDRQSSRPSNSQGANSSKKNGSKNKKRAGWSNKAGTPNSTTGPSSECTGLLDLETTSNCTGNTFTTISSSQPISSSDDCVSPISPLYEVDVPEDALSFLQAALPQIPTQRLKNALGKRLLMEQRAIWKSRLPPPPPTPSVANGNGTGELDMWAVISGLITSEDTREMDERGMALSSSASNFSSSGADEQGELDSEGNYALEDGYGYDDEERRHQAQLYEDERLARELAAQFEEEDRPKEYRKGQDEDEWAMTSKKKKKGGAKAKPATTNTNNRMTIKLNDVRQQQASGSRQPQATQGNGASTGAIIEPSTSSTYREALAVLLPSLASYLSSILKDKSPSGLLASTGGKKSTPNDPDSTTYIQNVFLNEKAVTSKYEGKVYLAVKACLEKVVEVLAVLSDEEAKKREREQEEKAKEKEKERELEKEMEQQKEKQKEKEGQRTKGGKQARRGSKKFPPEDDPYPPKKGKNRVRTAKDRELEREQEPGGSEEGGSTIRGGSGSTNDASGVEVEEQKTEEESGEENPLLFILLDILLPEYALAAHGTHQYIEVHQLLSDIELCIAVASPSGHSLARRGVGDGEGGFVGGEEEALDLARLLCDLYVNDADPEKELGRVMEMFADGLEGGGGGVTGGRAWRREGVSYASMAGIKVRQKAWGAAAAFSVNKAFESDQPFYQGVQGGVGLGTAETDPVYKKPNKPSPYQWQAVPVRKAPAAQPHTILPHLPTYTRDVNGIKVREAESDTVWVRGMQVPGWDPSLPSGSGRRRNHASEYEAAEREYRHSIKENMRRRDELLREAARMYNISSGNSMGKGKGRATGKVRGGDVAWYFADRAREFQEAAKKESLNAAKAMVLRKQALSGEYDAIDLHGTTVNEAMEIVLELLESRGRGGKPLKIVTGRGSHSANGISVLKPALKKRLVEDGWNVGAWDAGLVVR